VWDGDDLRGQIFVTNAMITYPYLMFGGSNGIQVDYACTYDIVFIIGGDGVIRYRGIYDDALVRQAIQAGIDDLDPTPVEDSTWGGVKALYR
jgi:hypothetical protein